MKQANDAESQQLATRDVPHLLERLSPGGAASSLAGKPGIALPTCSAE